MADRVAIIGGSTSRRDHFPWPVPDESALSGSGLSVDSPPYEKGISLEQAMKWALRVKQWSLTGSISWTGSAGARSHNITFNSGTSVLMYKLATPSAEPMLREAETVIFAGSYTGSIDVTFPHGTLTGGVGMLDVFSLDPIVFSDPYFYPAVSFGVTTEGVDSVDYNDNIHVATQENYDPVPAEAETVGTLIIDGIEYTLRLISAGDEVDRTSVSASQTTRFRPAPAGNDLAHFIRVIWRLTADAERRST